MVHTRSRLASDAPTPVTKVSAQKPMKPSKEVDVHKIMAEIEKCKAALKIEKEKSELYQTRLDEAAELTKKREEGRKAFEEKLEMAQKYIEEKKESLMQKMTDFQACVDRKEALVEERKVFGKMMDANREKMKKQLAEEVQKNGEKFQWQLCQICLLPYSSEKQEMTPKMLNCGHTICLSCAGKLSEGEGIRCPFDRTLTPFRYNNEQKVSTNFTILNMCNN